MKNIIETPFARATLAIILVTVIVSTAFILVHGFDMTAISFFAIGGAFTWGCCFILDRLSRHDGENNGRTA